MANRFILRTEGLRVYLNKNTRELHGHVFLADDGSFSAEFERPLSQKYGRPADYERLAAVILSDVWRGCQLDGKMTRDKQAEILKYSNERALREALDRAKITSFLNTPKAKIIRQRLDHKKYLGYVAIADETDISIKSHVDLYEINVKGWVWFYGDSKAKKGALHVKLPSEKGGMKIQKYVFIRMINNFHPSQLLPLSF